MNNSALPRMVQLVELGDVQGLPVRFGVFHGLCDVFIGVSASACEHWLRSNGYTRHRGKEVGDYFVLHT